MNKGKQAGLDPEQTLQTLDQLSQTIDVMSEVINRLRRHLSRQLRRQEARLEGKPAETDKRESGPATSTPARNFSQDGLELEISTPRPKLSRKSGRILH